MHREVRERKKKKDEREREEEREEVPLLSPPTLTPVIFCADIFLRRRHNLEPGTAEASQLFFLR